MTSIVFVQKHDELEARLGTSLDRWDVRHAPGPCEALALVESLGGVDVLVTDMDMEGMDGAQLLTIVRERFPATARIVLSRRSPRDVLLRAVGPAHQYLAAPVDVEELVDVIEHVAGASAASLRDPIRSLIGQADRLPSPPDVFQRLMDMTASDEWTVAGVAGLLGEDVALTAEMMKLVNSTFFGFFGEITSVERAVSLLGVDLVRSIVLGSKLFATDPAMQSWLDLDTLDRRSKTIANCARVLAIRDRASSELSAAAHLAGMVAEVGMLVMARVPDVDSAEAEPLNGADLPEVERLLFGGDRFEVGRHLLRLWGFTDTIVEPVSALSSHDVAPVDGLSRYLWVARRLVTVGGLDESSFSIEHGLSPEFDHAVALHCEEPSVLA